MTFRSDTICRIELIREKLPARPESPHANLTDDPRFSQFANHEVPANLACQRHDFRRINLDSNNTAEDDPIWCYEYLLSVE